MTFYIIDPNLVHEHGHHLEWDLSIGEAAARRGQQVVIFSHLDFPSSTIRGITIVPHFHHTTYEIHSEDPVTGRIDDFKFFNDVVANDLATLPPGSFYPTDTAFIPTLTENHFFGFVAWMKSFDPTLAPLFAVHLMFPSGLEVLPDGAFTVIDELQAVFYKLAFRLLGDRVNHVKLFGGGRQIAREFSAMTGRNIPAHAIPICPTRPPRLKARQRRVALLFAGDAKVDKGVLLLPELIEKLCLAHPDWDFLVHLNAAASWGVSLEAYNLVVSAKDHFNNLRLVTGRLDRGAYQALLEDVDCMISTYDPKSYARKSSGVVWESISLGAPMLLPENTWLAKEAAEWGAGLHTYAGHSADAIAAAFPAFARQFHDLSNKSAAAAILYQEANGDDAVIDQIAECWLPRFMAASLIAPPESRNLSLVDLVGDGWREIENYKGMIVRWTAKAFSIEFEWPYAQPWEVEIFIEKYFGVEQLEKPKAFCGNEQLFVTSQPRPDGSASLIVSGLVGRRDLPKRQLWIELPFTYRPLEDARDLGLFVKKLTLRPDVRQRERKSKAATSISILSPVTWAEDGSSFLLEKTVSGAFYVNPHLQAEISFEIASDASPRVIRSLQFFVNGARIAYEIFASTNNVWRFTAKCGVAQFASHGAEAEWDLLLDEPDQTHPIWVSSLLIGEVGPENQTAGALANAAPSTSIDELMRQKPPSVVEIAKPKPTKDKVGSPVVAPNYLSMSVNDQLLIADSVKLDELHSSQNYRHLDISVRAVSFGSVTWPKLKFKFCLSKQGRSIEFRKGKGWPDMFVQWPGTVHDDFGELWRLFDKKQQLQQTDVWSELKDRLLVTFVVAALPEIVNVIAKSDSRVETEMAMWHREAGAFQSSSHDSPPGPWLRDPLLVES